MNTFLEDVVVVHVVVYLTKDQEAPSLIPNRCWAFAPSLQFPIFLNQWCVPNGRCNSTGFQLSKMEALLCGETCMSKKKFSYNGPRRDHSGTRRMTGFESRCQMEACWVLILSLGYRAKWPEVVPGTNCECLLWKLVRLIFLSLIHSWCHFISAKFIFRTFRVRSFSLRTLPLSAGTKGCR